MTSASLADVVLVVAAVVWILARQVRRAPVKVRALVAAPLLLGWAGLRCVPDTLWHTPAALALVAGGGVASLTLGVLRGGTIRMWREPDGAWWRQGSRTTLILWAALLGVRLALAVVDRVTGHPEASCAGIVLASLALSFAGQNAVVLRTVLSQQTPGPARRAVGLA